MSIKVSIPVEIMDRLLEGDAHAHSVAWASNKEAKAKEELFRARLEREKAVREYETAKGRKDLSSPMGAPEAARVPPAHSPSYKPRKDPYRPSKGPSGPRVPNGTIKPPMAVEDPGNQPELHYPDMNAMSELHPDDMPRAFGIPDYIDNPLIRFDPDSRGSFASPVNPDEPDWDEPEFEDVKYWSALNVGNVEQSTVNWHASCLQEGKVVTDPLNTCFERLTAVLCSARRLPNIRRCGQIRGLIIALPMNRIMLIKTCGQEQEVRTPDWTFASRRKPEFDGCEA